MGAQNPTFAQALVSANYISGQTAAALDGTATVADGGEITYQWQSSIDGRTWTNIHGATQATYTPDISSAGRRFYRVQATNTLTVYTGLYPDEALYPADDLYPEEIITKYRAAAHSSTARIYVEARPWTEAEKLRDYMKQLRTPFTKLCRLRFLQPDGSTAFALDNNPNNSRSGAFIRDGSITVNLQNGTRRTATVTLANLDAQFDYNVNKVWFGQQIALDEGLVLSNGEDYYIQQGVFYIETPTETVVPANRTVSYPLTDKWAYLDGTLFGSLESTYEVAAGTNIFAPISAILALDRGNGLPVDSTAPVFTEYYNGKTQTLPDGTTASLTDAPYTLTIDNEDGAYADVALGLAGMINGWIGYDQTGALRIDPSQDDILDTNKPVQWQFSMEEAQILGATYQIRNTEVYNDYIIVGEALSGYAVPAGRATNLDPQSDTNIYTSLGRRTKRLSASGYYTTTQCTDLAVWKLKRAAVLQKAVTVSCSQLFHISENNLITIVRTDKPGAPVERHLIQGFTRPLSGNGEMTINCVSVQDFPNATVTSWPE